MHFGWFVPILVLDIFICCISERLLLEAEAEILMEIYVKYPILQENSVNVSLFFLPIAAIDCTKGNFYLSISTCFLHLICPSKTQLDN